MNDRESSSERCIRMDVTSRFGTCVSTRERSDPSRTIFFLHLFYSLYYSWDHKINGALVRNRTELAEIVDTIGCRWPRRALENFFLGPCRGPRRSSAIQVLLSRNVVQDISYTNKVLCQTAII